MRAWLSAVMRLGLAVALMAVCTGVAGCPKNAEMADHQKVLDSEAD